MTAKAKTHGFPHLPTTDLVLYADQIISLHLEQQDESTWVQLIRLTDGRTLRFDFGISVDGTSGDAVMDVYQQFERAAS